MYSGLGIQTPRRSGTNGYVQSNKFFVKPRGTAIHAYAAPSRSQTESAARKPNKKIVEHDRKRQIHLKLLILHDALTNQGYTEAEISDRLEEARKTIEEETASAFDDGGGRNYRSPLPCNRF